MYPLKQSLMEHHLVVLRMLGEWWEMDLIGKDKAECADLLAQALAGVDFAEEVAYLQPEEAAAVAALVAAGGRLLVATFTRDYGDVRQMGPARLEREEPWLNPQTVAEALWYRGFLYRGFDETDAGLAEFYYLPDELAAQLLPAAPAVREDPGVYAATDAPATIDATPIAAVVPVAQPAAQPAPVALPAPAVWQPAAEDAVDDLTTLLAFAQRGVLDGPGAAAAVTPFLVNPDPARRRLLLTLAHELGYLRRGDDGLRPTRAAVGWLRDGRNAQLDTLANAWRTTAWNELRHLPALVCEGSGWENDPRLARRALLAHLPPGDSWSAAAAIVQAVKQDNPDFQRPGGDYNIWYIRDVATGEFLRGFESWESVEGRQLRFMLRGPLHWLGMVDLADDLVRLNSRGRRWLANQPPPADAAEIALILQPDATVIVPRQASRFFRFQVARVCDPLPVEGDKPYLYQITPRSLALAQQQGIAPQRVGEFLREAAGGRPLPAGVARAIARWGEKGTEAVMLPVVILRVGDAAVLDTLQQNARTQPYIGERLGELAAVVRGEDWPKLRHLVAQLGLLIDVPPA